VATSLLTSGIVSLDLDLYPEECVREAVDAYKNFLRAEVRKLGPSAASIEIAIIDTAWDPAVVRREFLNYLLDISLRRYLRT